MIALPTGHDLPQPVPAPIEDRANRLGGLLVAIEAMDLDQLRALWTQHFGTPPALRSTDLMRLVLAWRLQARTYGGIDAAMRRQLRRTKTGDAGSIDLENGTRLAREWQGQHYEILVIEDGFEWQGNTYPSLSAVALAITGTRWNGPRFFGLRNARP